MTASATFTGATGQQMGSISTGRMIMTLGNTGAQTNRLTVGATTIAPGDRIQRSLDLTIDSNRTTGIMTGITLAVTASPSSALNTDASNGLRLFVQDCQTNAGASGWTESGPPYTYSCTKGADGAWNDLLNSLPTNDPTAVPSANTCASSNGGTGSYRAVSEYSSGVAMVNLPLTSGALVPNSTIHMVITMCFPTAAGDSLQNINSTLTFTFSGVQRSGANA